MLECYVWCILALLIETLLKNYSNKENDGSNKVRAGGMS